MPPDAPTGATAERPLLDRLMAREQAVVAVCLVAMAALAWAWLAGNGASEGMTGMGGMGAMAPVPAWTPAYLAAAFVMWTLMMVAMMLPSAAPMILLYGRVAARSPDRRTPLSALFVLAYLAVWTGFSVAATLAQAAFISTGLIADATLALGDRRLAGGLLILAGLYQLSPIKEACLEGCRSPLSFVMRFSRPGAAGALRLGLIHGLYCLGCCWSLMLLLFVGGVMNLAWIAALALAVLAEKLAPARLRIRHVVAVGLIVSGAILVG